MRMVLHFNLGKEEITNVVFITGLIGSGKTTRAYALADLVGADVISLDAYYDNPFEVGTNDAFNKYLKKNLPEYNIILDNFEFFEQERFNDENTDEKKMYWNIMDQLCALIKDFAMQNDSPVIVEGIQIFDSTIPNPELYFRGQTVSVIIDSPFRCSQRAVDRDEDPRDFDDVYMTNRELAVKLDRFVNAMKLSSGDNISESKR